MSLLDWGMFYFEDRWAMFSGDTLPAFFALVRDDPGVVEAALRTPIAERAADYTPLGQLDEIFAWVSHEGWVPDVSLSVGGG